MGFSKTLSACLIKAGTSSQSQIQSSKWWMKSSMPTCRNQPLCFQPSLLSIVTSAIQLIIERPVCGSGWEIG